jgi:hypothetical protein
LAGTWAVALTSYTNGLPEQMKAGGDFIAGTLV